METRELICIGCPMGCGMKVQLDDAGQVTEVAGNTCKRGDAYARKEVSSPTRIVTSSVTVEGGRFHVVSVKTKQDIPKGKIKECMKALQGITVSAPVCIGDVILKNVAETGVDVVATKHVPAGRDDYEACSRRAR